VINILSINQLNQLHIISEELLEVGDVEFCASKIPFIYNEDVDQILQLIMYQFHGEIVVVLCMMVQFMSHSIFHQFVKIIL